MTDRKLSLSEAWQEVVKLWPDNQPVLAQDLKDRLNSAGKPHVAERIPDLKKAGKMRGKVSTDGAGNVRHEYVKIEGA